jgi:hypothetical protein
MNDNDIDGDINELTEALGAACSGYDLPTVMTAITYIVADACVQSRVSEHKFLAQFNDSLNTALEEIKEYDNGNRTHH